MLPETEWSDGKILEIYDQYVISLSNYQRSVISYGGQRPRIDENDQIHDEGPSEES